MTPIVYTKSTDIILSWTPTPFDTLANQRNGPDIIKARTRIEGYWSRNRFFDYYYTPSPEYFRKMKKLYKKKALK